MEAQVSAQGWLGHSALKICSPARFAEISGRIDADLQDRIGKRQSFAFASLVAP